jgi:hypothetical protein
MDNDDDEYDDGAVIVMIIATAMRVTTTTTTTATANMLRMLNVKTKVMQGIIGQPGTDSKLFRN